MTAPYTHIEQAEHNKKVAKALLQSSGGRDWAIIATFYSALHYVQASLIDLNVNPLPDNHPDRNEIVYEKHTHSCFYAYKELYEASRKLRYLIDYAGGPASAPSLTYYSITDAKNFLNIDLPEIIEELSKKCPKLFNKKSN